MTRQTFYRFLKRTQDPKDWFLRLGCIRATTAGGRCCPLGTLPEAVNNGHRTPTSALEIGNVLTQDDVSAIYRAADDEPGHDPRVRAALLRNLGLTEATS